jgi:hypothetical protein
VKDAFWITSINYSGRLSWLVVGFIVFNVTFNNILVLSWRSVLWVEETGVPEENHWPVASHWQTLSHNIVSRTPCHERGSNSQLKSWITCKSNYHTITTSKYYCLVIFLFLLEIQLSEGFEIQFTSLTQSQFCACPKLGPGISNVICCCGLFFCLIFGQECMELGQEQCNNFYLLLIFKYQGCHICCTSLICSSKKEQELCYQSLSVSVTIQ